MLCATGMIHAGFFEMYFQPSREEVDEFVKYMAQLYTFPVLKKSMEPRWRLIIEKAKSAKKR